MNITIKNIKSVHGLIIVVTADKNGKDIYTAINFAGKRLLTAERFNYYIEKDNTVVIDNR